MVSGYGGVTFMQKLFHYVDLVGIGFAFFLIFRDCARVSRSVNQPVIIRTRIGNSVLQEMAISDPNYVRIRAQCYSFEWGWVVMPWQSNEVWVTTGKFW